jgi:outer membrane protein OmpA-like peptidoglycan-associated protein
MLFLLISVFVLQGCAVAVIGIGAGAGAVAYFNGKLTKTYKADYHETVWASRDTLEELKIPVIEVVEDELKTEIRAKRTDGTPVTIEVIRIDRYNNEVSVRTGNVGVWDRRVSEQIHGYIDNALGGKVIVLEEPGEEQVTVEERPVPTDEEIIEENLAAAPAPAPTPAPTPAPAPAPAPVEARTGTESVHPDLEAKRLKAAKMLENSAFFIFFEEDSNELSPKSMGKLDRIYGIVAKNDKARLTLNGYSDSLGEPSYNQMVSELRANTVKNYLVGKGVDTSRITTVAHGAVNALATNETAEGRRMNRRVEIEITTTQ